jgi:hypothetical protein
VTFKTIGDLKKMKRLIAKKAIIIQRSDLLKTLEFKICPPPGSIVWENRRVGINSRTKQILRWVIFVALIFGMLVVCNYA